jgi:hypothetical protein
VKSNCFQRSIWHTRSRILTLLLLIAALLLSHSSVLAFETDQYNLPPVPLADIGDEVSQHLTIKLRLAVEKINAEIRAHEQCLATRAAERSNSECGPVSAEQSQLAYLRAEDTIARAVFQELGDGVPPFTKMGTWMDSHHFLTEPSRYRTSYSKSIFILNPGVALTISPTVNLYRSEFGTDKIAHLFQQGYSYYKIYRQARLEGADEVTAEARAVRWGQK